MLYMETSFEPKFATYANLPAASTATETGWVPAAIDPIDIKAPVVASMLYMETSFEPKFATYANLPAGSTATESGSVPDAIIPMAVKAPVVLLMLYIETPGKPPKVPGGGAPPFAT